MRLSQIVGSIRVPKVIAGNNETVAAGIYGAAAFASAAVRRAVNIRQILSGALTANTYKTLLSVTGAGALNFLALQVIDATVRGYDIRLTIDGVVVATCSCASLAQVANGATVVIGALDTSGNTSGSIAFDPAHFNSSLLVEVRSTLNETDKLAICTNYRTY